MRQIGLNISLLFWLSIVGLVFLSNCGNIEFIEIIDQEVKLREDIETIEAYIQKHQLGTPDTTASGARFFVLNEGIGNPIQVGDLVKFEVVGYLLDSSVFFSNIRISITDTTNAFRAKTDFFEPFVLTHSTTGWSFDLTNINNNHVGTALRDAVALGFSRMKSRNSRLLVFVPSVQGYGQSSVPVGAFQILVYEFYILDVIL